MPRGRYVFSVLLAGVVVVAAFMTSTPLHAARYCTFDGYYDAKAATTQPCPGALPCEPGFYCTNMKRFPCPPGKFGAEPKLRTASCSAPCPSGFYCPEGTATPLECGATDQYCPLGAIAPKPVPAGYYSIGISSHRRDQIQPCEPGTFCVKGMMMPCPAGTYGKTSRLFTLNCSGKCPAGHYCPKKTIDPIPCPPGTFGAITGATTESCSGKCYAGFYCPSGSISPTAHRCSSDNQYCPEGSWVPLKLRAGTYTLKQKDKQVVCPRGSFCTGNDGLAELCPGGTYGASEGLSSSLCSGKCQNGYYCPRGSTSPTAFECGGSHVYCPVGSSAPLPVSLGYYTTGTLSLYNHEQVNDDATTRFAQFPCEPGLYCINGERWSCPSGTYGCAFALTTSSCSGKCAEGYFCPERSIVATPFACGSSAFYCPSGSSTPTPVSKGYCAIGGRDASTRVAQRLAQPGEFAWKGTCYPCPAGTFGNASGEVNPQCSGKCLPGFYCSAGSISATQHECGSAAFYCPERSTAPVPVRNGYYTSIDVQEQCPPGFFRDFSTTTSTFFDLVTGRSPISVNYGDYLFPLAKCVYCPMGTFKPQHGDSMTLCTLCPEFTTVSSTDRRTCECFRLAGGEAYDSTKYALRFVAEQLSCELILLEEAVDTASIAANNSLFTRFEQFPCEKGFYCQAGVRYPCPAGSYGNVAHETNPKCAEKCLAGYYCPLASTNSTAYKCGNVNVYCPTGSASPIPVLDGFYSIRTALPSLPKAQTGLVLTQSVFSAQVVQYISENATSNEAIRDSQRQCEIGYFCVNGRKFICPAGRYGDRTGETSPQCAGPCKRGYFCPPGSTSPTQYECGANDHICRTGSAVASIIPAGYYSIGLTNTTRFFQRPCEPGFYCMDGIKRQCPEGFYGATSGLQSAACSGKCVAGYYCPSYPFQPSVSRTQNECGNSTVYCPEGTGNTPLLVQSGHYTIGAGDGLIENGRNATRTNQKICPRGFYCRQGIIIRCPEGTYGDEEGLSVPNCKGWCPAGYFCPPGTADYRLNPCPSGSFATAGSSGCIICPPTSLNRSEILSILQILPQELRNLTPCTDNRSCCFYG